MAHNILIVEDDQQVRDVLRRKLEQYGYDVCEAADGNEAVNALRTVPFDLIITDIVMPEKDGIQIIGFVRKECPQTKTIVISAPGNELYLENARGLGAACFAYRETQRVIQRSATRGPYVRTMVSTFGSSGIAQIIAARLHVRSPRQTVGDPSVSRRRRLTVCFEIATGNAARKSPGDKVQHQDSPRRPAKRP
ncbi:MAG: response regulator transcription factor [Phycisphaerae bacterium]